MIVPDVYLLSWVPPAIVAARRLVVSESIDCVVTTSPYDSTHFVGWATRFLGPAWLADFRDPWTFEPVRPNFPLTLQKRIDEWMEGFVVRAADHVVANEVPVLEDFERRLGVVGAYVPNGWDPATEQEVGSAEGLLPSQQVCLVHTGGLSGVWGRDPRPFLEALALARSRFKEVEENLRFVQAGRLHAHEAQLIRETQVSGAFVYLGELSRADALAVQRRADALLLISSPRSSEAPGKLFEYLGADRPIVVLGSGNEAARIVQETKRGVTIPLRDVHQIVDVLVKLARGELFAGWRPSSLGAYEYPAPADAMIRELEVAMRRRRHAE